MNKDDLLRIPEVIKLEAKKLDIRKLKEEQLIIHKLSILSICVGVAFFLVIIAFRIF